MTVSNLPELIEADAVAEYLGFSQKHTRRLLASGQIPGRKVGRKWLVRVDVLEQMLAPDPTFAGRSEAVVPTPTSTVVSGAHPTGDPASVHSPAS